jgi:hypothetical protein
MYSEQFGLSNYAAWEVRLGESIWTGLCHSSHPQVAEIVGICKANNWICPTIYQVYAQNPHAPRTVLIVVHQHVQCHHQRYGDGAFALCAQIWVATCQL